MSAALGCQGIRIRYYGPTLEAIERLADEDAARKGRRILDQDRPEQHWGGRLRITVRFNRLG